jgi:hypothetical protein
MSGLYEAMASVWWDTLEATARERWLDAAEAHGRTRDLISAYTLMGDLREIHRAEAEQDRDEGR